MSFDEQAYDSFVSSRGRIDVAPSPRPFTGRKLAIPGDVRETLRPFAQASLVGFGIFIFVVALVVAASPLGESQYSHAEAANLYVARRIVFDTMLTFGDAAAVPELFAPEALIQTPEAVRFGHTGALEVLNGLYAAVPDAHWELTELSVTEDAVRLHSTLTGRSSASCPV